MKGTDCTEDQLEAARQFIADRQTGAKQGGVAPSDNKMISVRFGDVARLLAWYGAMRYKAGRDGTGGTLESPGQFDIMREAIH